MDRSATGSTSPASRWTWTSQSTFLDLKPSNILLDDQLRPRVADLGLAMLRQQDRAGGKAEVVGTPDYMAPEIRTDGLDAALISRADVYSLGVYRV
jgi:serine/threonine protein kinase